MREQNNTLSKREDMKGYQGLPWGLQRNMSQSCHMSEAQVHKHLAQSLE